jgi:ASPIC and UnbV
MLNGLALRNGFEAAPKVRKNRFECSATTAIIDAIGARVTWKAGTLRRTRLKSGGGSFLSSQDPRMVLGIGVHTKVDRLEIRWPAPS